VEPLFGEFVNDTTNERAIPTNTSRVDDGTKLSDPGATGPSALPWRVAWDGVSIEARAGATYSAVARCYTHAESRRNAALIVEAVNMHSALVAALRDLMDPQNFRADPTVPSLRRRDEALLNAGFVLSRLSKRDA
jgi:hypothetical protein